MHPRILRLARELALAGSVIAVATAAGALLRVNPTTFALILFTLVLVLAAWRGVAGGILASLLATACLNFFFLPPLHKWHVEDPENWVALGCFLVTSILASRIVTRARHVEALRESDALKTSLLRAVSHDLTTPLTAIALQIGQLRRRSTPDMQPSLDALEMEADRLRRRIDGLLAMARLEAGALVSKEPTPPADLFRAVRENLSLIARSRPIVVHVEPDCPDLDIDPSLALEILVNLVENAHRSSPAGEPITLLAQRHPAEESRVRLEILDQGPGIALLSSGNGPEVPDSDVARRGLGLEIAQGLAQALRGTVTLANRSGGGAVARLDLPAAPMDTLEATGSHDQEGTIDPGRR
jgi:two-component system, OmpR family, sensor histidine kinase KdpD